MALILYLCDGGGVGGAGALSHSCGLWGLAECPVSPYLNKHRNLYPNEVQKHS
jgi:hypothetical protein